MDLVLGFTAATAATAAFFIGYILGKNVQEKKDRNTVYNALQKAITELKEKDGLIEWKEAVLTVYERLLYCLAEAFCGEKPLEH